MISLQASLLFAVLLFFVLFCNAGLSLLSLQLRSLSWRGRQQSKAKQSVDRLLLLGPTPKLPLRTCILWTHGATVTIWCTTVYTELTLQRTTGPTPVGWQGGLPSIMAGSFTGKPAHCPAAYWLLPYW